MYARVYIMIYYYDGGRWGMTYWGGKNNKGDGKKGENCIKNGVKCFNFASSKLSLIRRQKNNINIRKTRSLFTWISKIKREMWKSGFPTNQTSKKTIVFASKSKTAKHHIVTIFDQLWFRTVELSIRWDITRWTLTVDTVTSRRKVVSTNEHLFTGWHSNIERPEIK